MDFCDLKYTRFIVDGRYPEIKTAKATIVEEVEWENLLIQE